MIIRLTSEVINQPNRFNFITARYYNSSVQDPVIQTVNFDSLVGDPIIDQYNYYLSQSGQLVKPSFNMFVFDDYSDICTGVLSVEFDTQSIENIYSFHLGIRDSRIIPIEIVPDVPDETSKDYLHCNIEYSVQGHTLSKPISKHTKDYKVGLDFASAYVEVIIGGFIPGANDGKPHSTVFPNG